jgi:membrane-bound ClpP family serine protease
MTFGPRTLLILIAVIIFALAAIGFDVRGVSLTALGLAFFAASWLVPEGVFTRRR